MKKEFTKMKRRLLVGLMVGFALIGVNISLNAQTVIATINATGGLASGTKYNTGTANELTITLSGSTVGTKTGLCYTSTNAIQEPSTNNNVIIALTGSGTSVTLAKVDIIAVSNTSTTRRLSGQWSSDGSTYPTTVASPGPFIITAPANGNGSCTTITGTAPAGTKYVRISNLGSNGLGGGSDASSNVFQIIVYANTSGTAPTVSATSTPTTIGTTTGAGAGGTISNAGDGINTSGVCWNTSANPTISNFVSTDGPITASTWTSSSLSGLTPNTIYHLRAYATNISAGTNYGPDVYFTTVPNAAIIAAPGTASSSSISGNWTAPSPLGTATYAYVFEYGTDNGFGVGTFTDVSVASGTLTEAINTGLTANTTYYYRVKATNLSGAQSSVWSAYQTTATTSATKLVTPVVSLGPITATNQGFTAQWASVTNASSYTVNIYQGSTLVTGLTGLTGITGTTVGVTGLTSNITYSYTVTANGDGITYANSDESSKSTTIRTLSTLKAITAFTISGVVATITESNHIIAATLPYGTVVTNLTPSTLTISANATYVTSGAHDFTSPVTYTVTAEDGSTQNYVVTITVLPPSSIKAITAFTITGQVSSVVTESTHTINVVMPFGTTRMTLAPSAITVTDASATVSPVTGVAQDFRSSQTYTVTAQDGTKQIYTVNVTNQTTCSDVDMYFGTDFGTSTSYTFGTTDVVYADASGGSMTASTSSLCGSASKRTQLTSVILNNQRSVSAIVIDGTSSGTSSRTLSTIETASSLGGTYSALTCTKSSTITGATCGIINISGLNIPSGSFIRLTFNGNLNLSQFTITPVCQTIQQLTAPTGLGSNTRTNQGFTAIWSDVSNEIGFTVKVYKVSDNSLVSTVTGIAADATSTVITGLDAGTAYTFTVTAIGDGDTYANSNESGASGSISTLAIYSITTASNDNAKGTMSSAGGTYDEGTSMSFTATPTSGSYRFVNWTEGGAFVSVANPYTFSASTNRTLVANFDGYTATITGNTNASTIADCATCDVTVVNAGFLIIDANKTYNSLTIAGGGKVTLNDTKSLTVTNNLNINSDTNGTGTFVDNNISGELTVNGTTSVNQNLTTGRNWYIASPVTVASSSVFNVPTNQLYWYDETNGSSATLDWPLITTNTSLNVAQGYVAYLTGSNPVTVTFTGGSLNTGDITTGVNGVPALTSTSAAGDYQGYNLSGNPYPSYLNAMMAINNANTTAGSTVIDPTIWYRTQSLETVPTYYFETVNTTSGIGTNCAGTGKVTGYIPPMQAFWVHVASTPASLTFNNSMRAHACNVPVGKGTVPTTPLKAPSAQNTAQQLLRLQVSNGTNSDEAIVYVNPNASNGFDNYDSQKMTNNNAAIPEIYTTVGNEKLVINGMNSIAPDTEIPLGFTTGQSNAFSIKATEISNFDSDTKVYLKDNLLNTEQDLTDGTAYTFASDVASTTSRFSVVFKSVGVTTSIQAASGSGDQSALIYKNANNQITAVCNGSISDDAYISVYNALGQKLEIKKITGTTTVIDRSFISGVYVVTVNNGGKSTTRKVILN